MVQALVLVASDIAYLGINMKTYHLFVLPTGEGKNLVCGLIKGKSSMVVQFFQNHVWHLHLQISCFHCSLVVASILKPPQFPPQYDYRLPLMVVLFRLECTWSSDYIMCRSSVGGPGCV